MSGFSIEDRLYKIYKKYIKKHKNSDSSQMCCMWSVVNPPDNIFEGSQVDDIIEEFDIELSEDDVMELYDLSLEEAVLFIQKKV